MDDTKYGSGFPPDPFAPRGLPHDPRPATLPVDPSQPAALPVDPSQPSTAPAEGPRPGAGPADPHAPAAPPVSPAVEKFRSCRWRATPEDGEFCTHRDVLPFAGKEGFKPESWCPECAFFKLRRTPKKRERVDYSY